MSITTEYDKLIRDKIPQIIESKGKSCETSILSDKQYIIYLRKKLQEEVDEFLADDNLEELADITEVIHALAGAKGYSVEDLERVRVKKREEKGGFEERIVLKKVVG